MRGKDVLSKIGADYIAANADAAPEKVQAFCAYASNWLRDRGVVGLGHTDSGMALRFADGEELPLFSRDVPADLPAAKGVLNITGNEAGRITKPILGDSLSFQITAR
jgi:hypothetical protein